MDYRVHGVAKSQTQLSDFHSLTHSVVSNLCDPMDSIVHGILQARILEWVAFPFSRGSSQLRNRNQVSLIAGDSLLAEPPRKLKNTGVGSLSLFQWIFPTKELNWGLLHCRRLLHQLSYQVSRHKLTHMYEFISWILYSVLLTYASTLCQDNID